MKRLDRFPAYSRLRPCFPELLWSLTVDTNGANCSVDHLELPLVMLIASRHRLAAVEPSQAADPHHGRRLLMDTPTGAFCKLRGNIKPLSAPRQFPTGEWTLRCLQDATSCAA